MARGRHAQLLAHLRADNLHPAIEDRHGTIWSYAWLDETSRRVAAGLHQLGVVRGDRVLAYLDDSKTSIVALIACHRIGAIFVPVNRRYQRGELEHIARDCQPAVALSDTEGLSALTTLLPAATRRVDIENATVVAGAIAWSTLDGNSPWTGPDPSDNDDAIMIYTSGTTGPSKGVTHAYAGLVHNMFALTSAWGFGPRDRLCLALPLFHVHGLCIGVHGSLLHGATILLHDHFDAAQVVVDFAHRGATVFMGVPTMYAKLIEHLERAPDDASELGRARLFTAGSAALSPAAFDRFHALTGHEILERYGMSETLITLSNPLAGPRRPGTVGRPVQDCEIRIVDDEQRDVADGRSGELWVRGPSLMSGYWNAPAATRAAMTADGWFATGDIAQRDHDGSVRLLGRRSTDLIKSGGYRIAAREIEDVIVSHPSVREAAVVGVPDDVWGQRIVAAVVTDDDPVAIEPALRLFCREHLADYKCPRAFIRVGTLPRNALGKIQKHRLVAELATT